MAIEKDYSFGYQINEDHQKVLGELDKWRRPLNLRQYSVFTEAVYDVLRAQVEIEAEELDTGRPWELPEGATLEEPYDSNTMDIAKQRTVKEADVKALEKIWSRVDWQSEHTGLIYERFHQELTGEEEPRQKLKIFMENNGALVSGGSLVDYGINRGDIPYRDAKESVVGFFADHPDVRQISFYDLWSHVQLGQPVPGSSAKVIGEFLRQFKPYGERLFMWGKHEVSLLDDDSVIKLNPAYELERGEATMPEETIEEPTPPVELVSQTFEIPDGVGLDKAKLYRGIKKLEQYPKELMAAGLPPLSIAVLQGVDINEYAPWEGIPEKFHKTLLITSAKELIKVLTTNTKALRLAAALPERTEDDPEYEMFQWLRRFASPVYQLRLKNNFRLPND